MKKFKKINYKNGWELIANSYIKYHKNDTPVVYIEIPAVLNLIGDVKNKKILDAGCGPGFYSEIFVRNGANVVAIDVSKNMVEVAKKRLKKFRVLDKIKFHCIDLKNIDKIKERNFDLITANLVLHFLSNKTIIFKKLYKMLKPGGFLIFSEMHPINTTYTSGWVWDEQPAQHPLWKLLYYRIDHYFKRYKWDLKWYISKDINIEIPSFHHTLQEYFEMITQAGFIVRNIVEPQPIKELKKYNPFEYDRTKRIPIFIIFKVQKPVA